MVPIRTSDMSTYLRSRSTSGRESPCDGYEGSIACGTSVPHPVPCVPLLFPARCLSPPLSGTDLTLDSPRLPAPCHLWKSHQPLFTKRLTPDSRLSMSQEGNAPAPKQEDGSVPISPREPRRELTARFNLGIITPLALSALQPKQGRARQSLESL